MKILYIDPVVSERKIQQELVEYLQSYKAEDTELDIIGLSRGPEHLEYRYYSALVTADVLHTLMDAEKNGYDAAIIGCFFDPGLQEAREVVIKMPVAGPGESAMHIASTLGHAFSIIVGRSKWIPLLQENIHRYGFSGHLASIKSIGMGVLEFDKDPQITRQRLMKASSEAIQTDGAEVIILGCTLQMGWHEILQKALGVPVIDVAIAALKYAEFLTHLKIIGWTHSKTIGYESPPQDELRKWQLQEQYDFKSTIRTKLKKEIEIPNPVTKRCAEEVKK